MLREANVQIQAGAGDEGHRRRADCNDNRRLNHRFLSWLLAPPRKNARLGDVLNRPDPVVDLRGLVLAALERACPPDGDSKPCGAARKILARCEGGGQGGGLSWSVALVSGFG